MAPVASQPLGADRLGRSRERPASVRLRCSNLEANSAPPSPRPSPPQSSQATWRGRLWGRGRTTRLERGREVLPFASRVRSRISSDWLLRLIAPATRRRPNEHQRPQNETTPSEHGLVRGGVGIRKQLAVAARLQQQAGCMSPRTTFRRFRAVCRRRLMVPIGLEKRSLISRRLWPSK